jgi:NAD(P)-dependent dehydrogenase (short-subunit alcohol dehydrogenase family)
MTKQSNSVTTAVGTGAGGSGASPAPPLSLRALRDSVEGGEMAGFLSLDEPPKLRSVALAAVGRIAILVNNAGGSRVLPIDAPEERWTEAMP